MEKKESIKKQIFFYYKILPAYNIDEELIYSSYKSLTIGSIVKINIKNKEAYGCVLSIVDKPKNIKFSIKLISYCLEGIKIDKKIIKFVYWFAMYNLVNKGSVLKQFLPSEKIINPKKQKFLKINSSIKFNLINRNKKFIVLYNKLREKPHSYKELIKFGYSRLYIKKLLADKIVKEEICNLYINISKKKGKINLKSLNTKQKKSYEFINKRFKTKDYKPIFLDGLTGSGKTEVYFAVIKDNLLKNKQVLILLPEIGLAEQWIRRFIDVFCFAPLQWNSLITNTEKNIIWQNALQGKPMVVVGARSGLFIPFSNLGITIIDEENDVSYKQEDKIIYNARDMAIVRAKISKSHVLLVSATPSLETYRNSIKRKYYRTCINERFGDSVLPTIQLINMRKEKEHIFSKKTISEINKNLQARKQSLILINRRGYAPISLCTKCGSKQKCSNCDINLVLHRKPELLICHHCGFTQEQTSNCNKCKSSKNIIYIGTGIEKVLEEAKKIFKTDSILALSSDTLKPETFKQTLKKIENNEIKILIGTQIISKGFDFLHLKKVFILDFDMWFYNSDIRTSEKIFQLTQQVTGRAGRGKDKGEVFIQTYDVENYLLAKIKNNDRESFYLEELSFRRKALLPPYLKMAAIIIHGRDAKEVESAALNIKKLLCLHPELKVLGPIAAPIFLIRNQYRYRILIKSTNSLVIQKKIKSKDIKALVSSKIKVKIDVDPYSFF